MTCGPGQEPITKTELAIVRGLEKVLYPLIVLAIAGLIGFSFQIKDTVAQLRGDHSTYTERDATITNSFKELDIKQNTMIRQQHAIEKDITKITTHQEHFKAEIEGLKKATETMKNQNAEMLRILRSQTR